MVMVLIHIHVWNNIVPTAYIYPGLSTMICKRQCFSPFFPHQIMQAAAAITQQPSQAATAQVQQVQQAQAAAAPQAAPQQQAQPQAQPQPQAQQPPMMLQVDGAGDTSSEEDEDEEEEYDEDEEEEKDKDGGEDGQVEEVSTVGN